MPVSERSTEAGVRARFDLTGRVAVITGGAGLLGRQHAEAIAEMGGVPVLVDIDGERAAASAAEIGATFAVPGIGIQADVTRPEAVSGVRSRVLSALGRIDILVNNAAHNPKIEADRSGNVRWSRLEHFPLERWTQDLAVGLTGAFLCSQLLGGEMARRGGGVILNIVSDLGVIAPDQRIYRERGVAPEQQPTKPVSYSVVKHGLIGLTRYLATYWAERGVRVNALCPGGVFTGQNDAFVTRLTQLIPLGRMAHPDEYKAAIVFLVSDASSYMTGANVVIDGGRSVW
jgi:NAD(P)-dependent dehydrogenase (short-subunit alcohol dehydrogenase family)